MSYNDLSCVSSLGNTGLANCVDSLGYDARLIWTTESFSFASESEAQDEDNWTAAINAGTVFPMPLFEEVEPAMEDDVEQETGIGLSLFVREGKYGGIGRFQVALCNLPKLRTFNEVKGRVFIVTGNGKVYGTSPDGVELKGFKLSKFHISALKGTDGSTVRFVEMRYQLKNITEMADYPAVPTLTWDPLDLAGVIDVDLTVDSSAADELVVSVARDCDAEAVTGLVEGDFVVKDDSGSEESITSFTDNEDGSYTFAFSSLSAGDYTVELKTPANQTTGGYDDTGAADFTI